MLTEAGQASERRIILAGLTPFEQGNCRWVPLAPAALVSYLRAQPDLTSSFQISMVDFRSYQRDADILQALEEERPWLLGWSTYVWNIKRVLALSQAIKERLPDLLIFLGGPQAGHPSAAQRLLEENPAIDGVICGEGEIALVSTLRHLLTPETVPLPAGLTLRQRDGALRMGGMAPLLPTLGRINSPILNGVLELEDPRGHFLSLQTYRGCPNACPFCGWGPQGVRLFPLETVVEELKWAFAKARVEGGFFLDADFFLFPERAKAILQLLAAELPEATWFFEANPLHIDRETMDLLSRFPHALLSIGLQSSNPEVLRRASRPTDLPLFRRCFQELRHSAPHLSLHLGLICGLPGESLESYLDSLEFALTLRPSSISPNLLMLLPGSFYFADPANHGIVAGGPPDYLVLETEFMSCEELAEAARLSSFIRACFDFPRLRSLVVLTAPLAEATASGPRPTVEIYQRLFHRMREQGLATNFHPEVPCRDHELLLHMVDWLRQAGHTAALYRALLEETSLDRHSTWSGEARALREFADELDSRFPPELPLTGVKPWKLPLCGAWSEPFLPGSLEERKIQQQVHLTSEK
ncbi:MAG: B12-binding domain-containing radical SAM protein [Coprothermobacterota bacterium]|nr:B12-binding domain-containing radical SAM protein [Coprothermobacterota bacterium]